MSARFFHKNGPADEGEAVASARRRSGNNDAGEQKSQGGREQTERAERMEHERLQVEEKERPGKHGRDDECEERSRASITKSGKSGCAKCRKVSQDSEGGCGNPTDTGIDATEHSGATPRRTTNNVVASKMRHGEVSSISQPNEGYDRYDAVKNDPRAPPSRLRGRQC